VEHGLRIIREVHEVCRDFPFTFAFKFQYRDLDTFIHPDFRNRSDIKYVKRFSETRLGEDEFLKLRDELRRLGFVAICTAFDEPSVDLVVKHGFDVLKIGSCSFTDWPLLEKIANVGMPIIASTAGATLDDIDKVVSFFEHREKRFALMHCVGEYPTPDESLELNQIDFFKARYPGIPIGYSTHEDPANCDAVLLAIAKGATIFEKHVGVATDAYPLNAYSASPAQILIWLGAARRALTMCGVAAERRSISEKERRDLRGLQRGVFARDRIRKGERVVPAAVFYAIPSVEGQLVANDISKYAELTALDDIEKNQPIMGDQVSARNLRGNVLEIITQLSAILMESRIVLPNRLELELSHHYGIENFHRWGAAIINCINREYCKKIIILFPGQSHPVHRHIRKEETFHVLHGDLRISIGGEDREYRSGDIAVVERDARHGFSSVGGVVFEEISTTHYTDDSFYEDQEINRNPDRKTRMTYWADWLQKPIV
jgi:sialic acid synthase SpsE/mannose-6-phosphate isomerase-like protein (cupin superfamily)